MKSILSRVMGSSGCLFFSYICLAGFVTLLFQLYIVNQTGKTDNSYVWRSKDPRITDSRRRIEVSYASEIRNQINVTNNGCKIPKLVPFHPSVKDVVGDPVSIPCTKYLPHLFSVPSTPNPVLKKIHNPEEFGFENCCFHTLNIPHTLTVTRYNPDELGKLTPKNCTLLTENETPIPDNVEHIAILCVAKAQPSHHKKPDAKIMDMFALTPPKPKISKKANHDNSKKLNVVILGLDSVSHMNFMRTMPFSYLFLTETLQARGMQGYVSVASNTLRNIIPVLTGLSLNELRNVCWRTKFDTFDNCPFIWKEFSEAGYATALAEDATALGMFSYSGGGSGGFNEPPVDYYLNPFTALQDLIIGFSPKSFSSNTCYGPRPSFAVLLNYMKRLAVSLPKDSNYFQLTWATSLFHSNLNYANLGDGHLLRTLKWFHGKGHLENTVLVLMSDHGMRYGQIRRLRQGQTEERMPFLYMVFPKWFKEKYPVAVKNYYENRMKLTTPYDLHETLKDLLTPANILNERIQSRASDFNATLILPKGISLFLPIPSRRNCADAKIDLHQCICFPKARVRVNNTQVKLAAQAMVDHVNNILRTEENCAKLGIQRILIAERRVNFSASSTKKSRLYDNKEFIDLGITLMTQPGGAVFEGTLVLDNRIPPVWKVSGAVSRIDPMKGQGQCVDHGFLKQYCFCEKSSVAKNKR